VISVEKQRPMQQLQIS